LAVVAGGIGKTIAVASLQVTGVVFTTTPALAPAGTGKLTITLTDPVSGYQEVITYSDSSVLAFWATLATAPSSGDTLSDTLAKAVFAKLIADAKLPAGTLA
jgi:hypothetical protein